MVQSIRITVISRSLENAMTVESVTLAINKHSDGRLELGNYRRNMSQILINDYLKQLDIIRRISGSSRETIIREAFKDLLKAWGKQQGLIFLAEYPLKTATKTNIAVDGALLHELRMPLGYWEAKDAADDLDAEVVKKFKRVTRKTTSSSAMTRWPCFGKTATKCSVVT